MRILPTILAACAALAPACVADGDRPELLSVDPEQPGFELSERPVILFYVDGLRADVLEDLARRGELPRLSHLLLERAARVRSAVTSVPSVTYANAVTMLTGCWPSTHGVVSNACFDRNQLLTRDFEHNRERAAEDDSRATLYELLSSELTAGVAMPFERGVKISRAKSAKTGGAAFGATWVMGRKQEADQLLSEQFGDLAAQAREIGEWPAFVAVHLPGIDAIGHEHGSDTDEYRASVANLDAAIGDVLEAFERGGMLERLTLVLTSDHGHHSAPNSAEIEELLAEALGTDVLVALEDDGDQPFLERFERYSPARAVVVPGGMRQASVHLRVGREWHQRPTLEEILAFPAASGAAAGASMPERVLRNEAIELVALRAGENAVRVHGRRGVAAIERSGDGPEPSFRYEVLEGEDPLGYDSDPKLLEWAGTPRTSREWLAATAELSRPDVVPQLVSAFDDPRAGDLLLFAAPGWDFAPDEYLGGHGGLAREELIVPMYVAGPGIRPGLELPAARLVDLAPTLLELAGVEPARAPQFDGVSFAARLRAEP